MGSFAHPSTFDRKVAFRPGQTVRYSGNYLALFGGASADPGIGARRGKVVMVHPDYRIVEVAWNDAPDLPRSVRAANLDWA